MKIFLGRYTNPVTTKSIAKRVIFWKDEDSKEVENLSSFLRYGMSKKSYKKLIKKLEKDANIVEETHPENDNLISFNFDDMLKVFEIQDSIPTTKLQKLLEFINRKIDKIEYVHVDNYDTWNADQTLAKIILPVLKKFKQLNQGGPKVDFEDVPEYLIPFKSQTSDDPSDSLYVDLYYHDRWDYVLDTMIYAFNAIAKDLDEHDDYYEPESIKEGLRLFGKYFQNLWN